MGGLRHRLHQRRLHLTEGMVVLENTLATLDEPDKIFEAHVRFRFDKGKENFAIRKF